jgi:hypothetical protein
MNLVRCVLTIIAGAGTAWRDGLFITLSFSLHSSVEARNRHSSISSFRAYEKVPLPIVPLRHTGIDTIDGC